MTRWSLAQSRIIGHVKVNLELAGYSTDIEISKLEIEQMAILASLRAGEAARIYQEAGADEQSRENEIPPLSLSLSLFLSFSLCFSSGGCAV